MSLSARNDQYSGGSHVNDIRVMAFPDLVTCHSQYSSCRLYVMGIGTYCEPSFLTNPNRVPVVTGVSAAPFASGSWLGIGCVANQFVSSCGNAFHGTPAGAGSGTPLVSAS